MSTICFANIKGGSGKTTAALLFAGEIMSAGGKVVLLEGDPNRPLARWASARADAVVIDTAKTPVKSAAEALQTITTAAGDKRCVVVTTDADDQVVLDWLDGAATWAHVVVADPEGSPNQWLSLMMSQADLVIVPFAPTPLEAIQVASTVTHIGQTQRMTRRPIPYRILMTRVNPLPTRDEKAIRKSLLDNGLPLLDMMLMDRPAYRAVFRLNALISELDPKTIASPQKARTDVMRLVAEVNTILQQNAAEAAA